MSDSYQDFIDDEYAAEMEMLREELMEDNEAWELSNEDGWYYADDDYEAVDKREEYFEDED